MAPHYPPDLSFLDDPPAGDGELLLRAIARNPGEMTPKFAYLDWAQENPDLIRGRIAAVAALLPALTGDGVTGWYRWATTGEMSKARFDAERAYLLGATREFALSTAWLADKVRRKTVDHRTSSYGYKHMVERAFDAMGYEDRYVSNGAFIAAAVYMGFPYQIDRPNVLFGISRRSLGAEASR